MDPRDRVTQTAFRVHPGLLGVELASPTRRAAALGVDLLLAGTVAAVGGGAVAGLAAAVLFVLVAMRSGGRHPLRRLARGTLVGTGALILFGLGVAFFGAGDDDEDGPPAYGPSAYGPGADPDELTARALADVDARLEAAGLEPGLATGRAGRSGDSLTGAEHAEATAALRAHAEAFAARDPTALDTLAAAARDVVAGAELDRRAERARNLRRERAALEDENDGLRESLDRPSFLRTARALGADFGLSLGWIGAYFTLTMAFWRGYTPGKRLAGVRVVRLDGGPLSLWTAFGRFGGYAAGLVTGLVGFAQVLWDPNRQGLQDKVVGTVVVRMDDPATPRRAPEAA